MNRFVMGDSPVYALILSVGHFKMGGGHTQQMVILCELLHATVVRIM